MENWPEEHRPAVLRQQLAPHGHQAGQVGAHAGLVAQRQRADGRQRGLDVHRAGAAQGAEAAVHLGADAAGAGAGPWIGPPELLLGKLLGQGFGDGQRVPHGKAVVLHQHGHLADRVLCRRPPA
jgi:hypothetical protein